MILFKEVVRNAEIVAPEQNGPTASKVGVTFGFTVTTVATLVAEQPLDPVTVTVYEPAAVAVYVAPVPTVDDPLLQEYDEPSLAVKTTLPPLQNVVADPAVIVAVGNGLIVRGVDTELVHPYIVKEYEIPRTPEYPILFAVTTPL